jgi:hypothetical protein
MRKIVDFFKFLFSPSHGVKPTEKDLDVMKRDRDDSYPDITLPPQQEMKSIEEEVKPVDPIIEPTFGDPALLPPVAPVVEPVIEAAPAPAEAVTEVGQPEPKKTPAKKAPAKKAPAVKKPPVAKKAPIKLTPAKKVPAKKAAPKK